MKKVFLSLILLSFLQFGCSSSTENEQNEDESTVRMDDFPETMEIPVTPEDNSMSALDWAGIYKGTLPCADCEGIETELALNQDGTYSYKTNYLGKNDALEEEYTGKFTWDEQGRTIQLEGLKGAPGKYQVGENQLWHLDQDGNRISGDLAENYILKKQ
ncbi:copper resistance protein NlpE [Algoriphagus sp.]|uniref:copper resistance protein NlpE n=1 Tax=Algoriphagus sp. TaxID=1872435 RepID=UPI00261AC413|nr:copper resistance protein NlpE [Algoriphagus sp.]